jgi:hypothetical protein
MSKARVSSFKFQVPSFKFQVSRHNEVVGLGTWNLKLGT